MKFKKTVGILVIVISLTAAIAASAGIFSHEGGGAYEYRSIRGTTVTIYGKGLYQHMSSEVAVQGIAQDYVTLFIAIPFLVISFLSAKNGSLKGRLVLAGALAYFMVTYLFYLVMGMYNSMYLLYVLLLGLSFYSFLIVMLSFNNTSILNLFAKDPPVKIIGGILIFNAFSIALLWLSIILPPLLEGTIIPPQVEHYTTLVVQGLDLAILLPGAVISGVLFIKKRPFGYLFTSIYFIFLVLLMIALTAKVIAMAVSGYNVFPVIFIIPAFAFISMICAILIFKNMNTPGQRGSERQVIRL